MMWIENVHRQREQLVKKQLLDTLWIENVHRHREQFVKKQP